MKIFFAAALQDRLYGNPHAIREFKIALPKMRNLESLDTFGDHVGVLLSKPSLNNRLSPTEGNLVLKGLTDAQIKKALENPPHADGRKLDIDSRELDGEQVVAIATNSRSRGRSARGSSRAVLPTLAKRVTALQGWLVNTVGLERKA